MKIILGFVLVASLFVVSAPVFSSESEYEYTEGYLWPEMEHKMAHPLVLKHISEEYNGIKIKDWAKTNSDYNSAKGKGGRIAGEVVGFEFKGEAYPVAVFKGGKRVSVFWLEKMRTQHRP